MLGITALDRVTARRAMVPALLLLVLTPGDAGAQPPADASESSPPPGARRLVERFEQRRRALLPPTPGAAGRCDVRIGSYCYWYDASDSAGPAEPPAIARARRTLLAALDSMAGMHPDDPWLAGQRVRYGLEEGETRPAVLPPCSRPAWWCSALAGLVLHAGDRPAAADSAFSVALALMPADAACRWRDLSPLLDSRSLRVYRSLTCSARAAYESRFWWLADPLWSRPGSDARSEHLSRRVIAALASQGATPYGGRWNDDMTDLVLRYGWPERWSRREERGTTTAQPVVTGHDPTPSHQWAPGERLMQSPFEAASDDWQLDDPRARSRYSAPHARWLHELDATVALLRRGDSLLAVAAIAVPATATPLITPASYAALVLASDSSAIAYTRQPVAHPMPLVGVIVPDRPLIASIEVVGDSGHAARARFAVRPPPTDRAFGVSDLLVFAPRRDADTTFDAARQAPVATEYHASAAPLGVYWELYGLGDRMAAVRTELVLHGEGASWTGRALARLRGRRGRPPPLLRWVDVTAPAAVRSRVVHLDLTGVAAGDYILELQVRAPDGRQATARRRLRLLH